MKKRVLFLACLMLATSLISIFSINCIAVPTPEKSTATAGLVITTVSGLFFNIQQTTSSVSFYAIRIHYWTTGPFRQERGVVNFKTCTGGIIIGPISLLQIGLMHNLMLGTFTFLGDIHYTPGNFS